MRMGRHWVLGLALFAIVPSAAARNVKSINQVPGRIESTAQRLTHALSKQGLEVGRGYLKLWSREACDYTIAKLGACFGNNPAAPYVTLAVPPWPEEFVDSNSNMFTPSLPGYNDVFRLDPREAIVILAQMPPPARYFSIQSFVFTRPGTYDTESETYEDVAGDPDLDFLLPLLFRTVNDVHPDRIVVWASLSNPINNVVVEAQSGAAFDALRYFIITPDDFMDRAVREAFAGVRVDEESIFTERIPSHVNLGLDRAADDFVTFIRYARPDDGGAPGTPSDTWRENLPMVVLRVRDTRHDPRPYAPAVLEPRTAFDEFALQPDLIGLVSAVHRRWTGEGCAEEDCSDVADSFRDVQTEPVSLVGPLCLAIGQNCLGDNQDTSYQIHRPQSLDHGEIYAVAGTLGTETGNATYVGFGINRAPALIGVANLSEDKLKDTASAYAGEVNNTGQFFLYYFARDCSGLEDLTGGNCFEIDETMIPPGDYLTFTVRDYVRKGTQRGPDSSLVLPPMLIELEMP